MFIEFIVNVTDGQTTLSNSHSANYNHFCRYFGLHIDYIILQAWVIINKSMENQKSSSTHPMLSNTSRQFYSRRIPTRNSSNTQLDRVLKILNQESHYKPPTLRIKTEQREDSQHRGELDSQGMRKLAKLRVSNLLKKQSKDWQQLFDQYQLVKKSSSRDTLMTNDLNFMLKFSDMLKEKTKEGGSSDKMIKVKQAVELKKQRRVELENIRLTRQIQLLQQKMEKGHFYQGRTEHRTKTVVVVNQTIEHMNEVPVNSTEETDEIQRQIQYLRQTNDLLRGQKKQLQQKIIELKSSNQNLCDQILRARASNSENHVRFQNWRNIMTMQHEELLSREREIKDLRKQMTDLSRKYQNMLKRMSKLSNPNDGKIIDISKKYADIFTEQAQSFQKIRNMFLNRQFFSIASSQKQGGLKQTCIVYKKCMGDKETLANSQGVKKAGREYFRYFRPNFYTYLEKYFEYQGVDRDNFQQINLSVDINFLLSLRAILDNKFNEYLLAPRKNNHCSSLSSFTISWLCNYAIDCKTKKVGEITTDLCFQTIGGFYVRLMSPSLNGSWQVITFRQFLLETLSPDELLFYLKSRYCLFRGECNDNPGSLDQIWQVNYLQALFLIQQVVADFEYRKKLEEYVKRTVDFQRRKQLVDGHFILRLLLEYYQYKKAKIFAMLTKTFVGFTRERNFSMSFQSFLKIFDYNFCELTLRDRVDIYQKAFSLGKGVVTLQGIFTVLNQEGYLYIQVQKMFEKHLILTEMKPSINSQEVDQIPVIRQMQQMQIYIEQLNQKYLKNQNVKLGLESYRRYEKDCREMKGGMSFQALFDRFQYIFELGMLNFRKMFMAKKIKEEDVMHCLPSFVSIIKVFIKNTIAKRDNIQLLMDFKKKNAAKLIAKFYRKKKGYLNRSFLSNSEPLERGNQKSQQIRKQFSLMIESLKKKYNANKLNTELQLEG